MTVSASIQSMTGFGSGSVDIHGIALRADMRSVNGKGFDLRLRLPQALDDAESDFRKLINEKIKRGNVQLAISTEQGEATQSLVIDETLFATLAGQAKALAEKSGLAPPSADAILQMRGVVAASGDVGFQLDADLLRKAALAATGDALGQLVAAREQEGAATAKTMMIHLDQLETLIGQATKDPSTRSHAMHARLVEQIERLSAVEETSIDPQRLAAEAALLATKADIREELDRLTAHVASARALFADGGAIGRKLEFLSQEFNREANTLCSKSPSASLTKIGLDLKSVIDQLREQAANIA